ncbi:MAG: 3-deoxy-7-phosphoheptulonate synthase [Ruminococcaceae bacterium]|nr:3-deoxy-7-phosphoheptulonate synthase [Oscillospiraceae bacterium]
MSMIFEKKLPIPKEVKEAYPLSEKAIGRKAEIDEQVAKIFKGESDKLVLIIGPCSADREDAVLEYIERLCRVQEKVSDKLILIPRVYTNKPRTNGSGYKGMAHQPDPHAKPDTFKGILAIRELHSRVLTQYGMSTADEMLYPANYRYLDDLMSYVAIGARSVENQEHRLVSSGITVPVGMKNPTSGDFSVMLNSIEAAQHSHTFVFRGWQVKTTGNDMAHAILRGYVNKHGKMMPNYHYEDLELLYDMYTKRGLKNLALVVDANHSNSAKNPFEQARICKEVLHSTRHNNDVKSMVKGFMIESYLEDGSQSVDDGVYGKSITDPCLGWEKSERLIYDIADLI